VGVIVNKIGDTITIEKKEGEEESNTTSTGVGMTPTPDEIHHEDEIEDMSENESEGTQPEEVCLTIGMLHCGKAFSWCHSNATIEMCLGGRQEFIWRGIGQEVGQIVETVGGATAEAEQFFEAIAGAHFRPGQVLEEILGVSLRWRYLRRGHGKCRARGSRTTS